MSISPHFSVDAPSVKVFITSAYTDSDPITAFLEFIKLDKIKKHKLVTDPSEAEVILFIENSRYHADYYFSKLKNHALVKKYPNKTYMYNPHDVPWYVLPGLYASMPKQRFNSTFMVACPYLETINPYIQCDFSKLPDLLFAFNGAISTPIRQQLTKLTHPRGKIIISTHGMYAKVKPKNLQLEYADLLKKSKFILCPRGIGTSSIRLFETLQAGRVPVIVSDNWVPPLGPDWTKIAVFVAEDQINNIPEILEAEERNWEEKSKLGRQAWEDYFAPDTIFNYFITSIISLDKSINFTLHSKLYHFSAFCHYGFRKIIREYIKPYLVPILSRLK